MKDFRVQLEDLIVARLAEIAELKYVAASLRAGFSKPTAYPAVTVTYEGFRRILEANQIGSAQHTLVRVGFFITLATSSGQPAGTSQRGPDGAPDLLNKIFVKLSGFLLDFGDVDLQTPWPCEVEDELPYEISGQSVSWQQGWFLQLMLAGFAQ